MRAASSTIHEVAAFIHLRINRSNRVTDARTLWSPKQEENLRQQVAGSTISKSSSRVEVAKSKHVAINEEETGAYLALAAGHGDALLVLSRNARLMYAARVRRAGFALVMSRRAVRNLSKPKIMSSFGRAMKLEYMKVWRRSQRSCLTLAGKCKSVFEAPLDTDGWRMSYWY